MMQRIDYHGLPFCFSSCRWMGHLRKDFPNRTGATELEENLENYSKYLYMSEENSEDLGSCDVMSFEDTPGTLSESFISKLKSIVLLHFLNFHRWNGISWKKKSRWSKCRLLLLIVKLWTPLSGEFPPVLLIGLLFPRHKFFSLLPHLQPLRYLPPWKRMNLPYHLLIT